MPSPVIVTQFVPRKKEKRTAKGPYVEIYYAPPDHSLPHSLRNHLGCPKGTSMYLRGNINIASTH